MGAGFGFEEFGVDVGEEGFDGFVLGLLVGFVVVEKSYYHFFSWLAS